MSTYKHFEVGWTSTYGQYIPPDFDPDVLRKHKVSRKRSSDGFGVRNMLPFTVICTRCGAHMARGTKFNMQGQNMQNSHYLGQSNVIFSFKCPECRANCQFRTDYENSGYATVSGCVMHNEPFKKQAVEERKTQAELEQEDAMKRLERQTEQLKNSTVMQEQVDDLIRLNRRKGSTNTDFLRKVLKNKRSREDLTDGNDDDGAVFRQKRLKLDGETSTKEKRGLFKGMFGAPVSNEDVSIKVHLAQPAPGEVSLESEPFSIVSKPKKNKKGKRRKKKKKKIIVEVAL